jgi:hypothetical protein
MIFSLFKINSISFFSKIFIYACYQFFALSMHNLINDNAPRLWYIKNICEILWIFYKINQIVSIFYLLCNTLCFNLSCCSKRIIEKKKKKKLIIIIIRKFYYKHSKLKYFTISQRFFFFLFLKLIKKRKNSGKHVFNVLLLIA